jgi:chromosome segregation ATPase
MNPLHDCVARLADGGPVDTVLHVGPADPSLLERYLALWPRRVVWVDDDTERIAALREAAAAAGAATLLEVTVACIDTQAGPRAWQRFDVAAFDGPLPLRDVVAAYPGLRAPETRPVVTRALEPLVAAVVAALPPGARAVLAIDQPGREAALVESLAAETLAGLGALLLRGCSQPFFDGGCTLDDTLQALSRRSWRVRARGTGLPWWPAVVLQFDADVQALAAQLADAESKRLAEQARHEQALVRAREQAATLQKDLATVKHGLALRDATIAQRDDALAKAREHGVAVQKDVATLKQGLAQRDASIAQRDAALALAREHDATSRKEIAELKGTLGKRETAIAQRDEAMARAREQDAALRRDLSHLKEGVGKRDATITAQAAELAQARKDEAALRQELARSQAAVAMRNDTLVLRAEALAQRDAEIKRRDVELRRIEAELKRVDSEVAGWKAEIARRDALHQTTLDKAVALERAGVQRVRDEMAKVAQSRDAFKVRVDELAAKLAEAVAARDANAREKAALQQQREKQTAALQDTQRQVHRLEGAAATAAAHQRLLQDALSQAEGQLALVRDLLLRD